MEANEQDCRPDDLEREEYGKPRKSVFKQEDGSGCLLDNKNAISVHEFWILKSSIN